MRVSRANVGKTKLPIRAKSRNHYGITAAAALSCTARQRDCIQIFLVLSSLARDLREFLQYNGQFMPTDIWCGVPQGMQTQINASCPCDLSSGDMQIRHTEHEIRHCSIRQKFYI